MISIIFFSFFFLNFEKVTYYLLEYFNLCLYTLKHLLHEDLLTYSVHLSLLISFSFGCLVFHWTWIEAMSEKNPIFIKLMSQLKVPFKL